MNVQCLTTFSTPLLHSRPSFRVFLKMDFLAEKFSGKGHDNDFAFHQILGRPLPLDEHACSVSLPTWADVVGYEEGDPRVSNALKIGYPRFKIHASIERLMDLLLLRHKGQSSSSNDIPALTCMIWPTAAVAEAFRCFLITYDTSEVRSSSSSSGGSHLSSLATVVSVGFEDLHGVLFPDDAGLRAHAKKYWQHTGEIISSRVAEAALQALGAGCVTEWSITRKHSRSSLRQSSSDLHMQRLLSEWSNGGHYNATLETLCGRIAGIVEEPRESVTLCISGMASIFAALKSLLALVNHAMAVAADDTNAADDVALSEETKQIRLRRLHEFGKVVVFGFPYLDTLKMMRESGMNPLGCTFFGAGDQTDLDSLEASLRQHRQQQQQQQLLLLHQQQATTTAAGGDGYVFSPTGGVSAVFTEFPSNPLLKCHDLRRLSRLAHEFGFLLVVDDTVGNFANTDLLHSQGLRVDMVCTSLTKIFNGRGDCLAGSLIVNSYSHLDSSSDSDISAGTSAAGGVMSVASYQARARLLKEQILCSGSSSSSSSSSHPRDRRLPYRVHVPPLYEEDAATLEVNSRTFLQRSNRINETAGALAKWLAAHPAVEQLYYAETQDKAEAADKGGLQYQTVMRQHSHPQHNGQRPDNDNHKDKDNTMDVRQHVAGYSSLMSIILREDVDEKIFFDALEVCKGPSLGTNFTICCPYTLLAHYLELDWAAGFGVDRRLVRVSVGLEDLADLISRFDRALRCAQHAQLWHALRSALTAPHKTASTRPPTVGLLPVVVSDQIVSRIVSFLVT